MSELHKEIYDRVDDRKGPKSKELREFALWMHELMSEFSEEVLTKAAESGGRLLIEGDISATTTPALDLISGKILEAVKITAEFAIAVNDD